MSDDPSAARARPRGGHAIPVIELWGVLLVPLQGDLTDEQMERVTEQVLDRLRKRAVHGLVLDASGVWLVDSHLCSSFVRLATSARLMGVPSVLCGLGPDVVLTLLEMGFEMAGVRTTLGLEEALEALGLRVIARPERDAPLAPLSGS